MYLRLYPQAVPNAPLPTDHALTARITGSTYTMLYIFRANNVSILQRRHCLEREKPGLQDVAVHIATKPFEETPRRMFPVLKSGYNEGHCGQHC